MRIRNYDPVIAHAQNIKKGFSTSYADLQTIDRKADVFLKNIRFLIKHGGTTQATVAKEAAVPPTWLRQLSRRGLGQLRKGSWTRLDRLRRFFKLDSVDELWLEELIDSIKHAEDRAKQIQPFLRSEHWPQIQNFLFLLQSNDYDFLGRLVNKLYEQETAKAGRGSHNREDKASPKDLTEYRRSRKLGGGGGQD